MLNKLRRNGAERPCKRWERAGRCSTAFSSRGGDSSSRLGLREVRSNLPPPGFYHLQVSSGKVGAPALPPAQERDEGELSFSSLLTERSSVGQGLIPFSKQLLLCSQPAGWGRGRCGSSSRSGHAVFACGLCHVTSEGIINQVFPSTELHSSPPPAAINTSSVCCGLWRALGLVFMVTLHQQVCGFGLVFSGILWEQVCARSSWFGVRVLGMFWVLLGERSTDSKRRCPPASPSPARPSCCPFWPVHTDSKPVCCS